MVVSRFYTPDARLLFTVAASLSTLGWSVVCKYCIMICFQVDKAGGKKSLKKIFHKLIQILSRVLSGTVHPDPG